MYLNIFNFHLRASPVIGRLITFHDAPDFLYAALDTTACVAFIKESRMKFANANQLHRKSGGAEDE
jgi:hypothetical protein